MKKGLVQMPKLIDLLKQKFTKTEEQQLRYNEIYGAMKRRNKLLKRIVKNQASDCEYRLLGSLENKMSNMCSDEPWFDDVMSKYYRRHRNDLFRFSILKLTLKAVFALVVFFSSINFITYMWQQVPLIKDISTKQLYVIQYQGLFYNTLAALIAISAIVYLFKLPWGEPKRYLDTVDAAEYIYDKLYR